jgi:glutaminase
VTTAKTALKKRERESLLVSLAVANLNCIITMTDDSPQQPPSSFSSEGSNTSSDAVGLETASRDILRELYWFVVKAHGAATETDRLTVGHVVDALADEGILFWRDERFDKSQDVALLLACQERAGFTNKISVDARNAASAISIDFEGFVQLVTPCARLFLKAFSEELVIPDWSTFITDMTYHYYEVAHHTDGENAQYIPILREAEPEKWGLSICSTDGQRVSVGDALVKHTLQSVSKPVTYALALAKEGEEFMSEWIGVEPAGRPFNTQDLDPATNRPFNASINSGAIMAAGVFASRFPDCTWREIVDNVRKTWYELCGNDLPVGFSAETFESEKESAFNNYAIAYNLKGRSGLPRDVDLHKMLDVYLGCCSIEVTTEALAVAAATLANGGVCPITGKEVFPADVIRSVLSETMTCGMYDQAGHFAVEVGLPAKSGVSGALMVIVPNVFGFATFSPRLNKKGNSVRGIEFCKRLVNSYRVHLFEPLRSGNTGAKVDPRKNGWKNERMHISRMAWAVEVGEVHAKRLRDIFLFALCQTAVSSEEGLSDRMLDEIRHHYEQIYQVPVDEKYFQDVLAAVRLHPDDLLVLEELTKDANVSDSFRSIVSMAMLNIIMVDGRVGETERDIAVRISVLLGTDRGVALMEINRYEHNQFVGHRFRDIEYCDMIDDVGVQHRRSSSTGTPRGTPGGTFRKRLDEKAEQQDEIRASMEKLEVDAQEELLFLRKEVSRLRRKVEKLTNLLHAQPRK